jgi:hypothetical protein
MPWHLPGSNMNFLPACIVACLVCFGHLSCEPSSVAFSQELATQPSFKLKNDPLTADGQLSKISDKQDLFELKTVGTKLETKVVSSYQEAQGSVSQIRSLTRSSGGSSSSGNGTWMSYFQGDEFFGHVSDGKVSAHMLARFPNLRAADNHSEFSMLFQELSSPQRELEIGVDEGHVFNISLKSSELGYLFRFRQEESGRIVCQEICNEFVFARSASSFDEFSKHNPRYVQNRLMQVLDFIGVEKPPTRYSTAVSNQVLMMLRPVNEERMIRFKDAVEKMDASSYQERESASAELEKNFEQWQDLIRIGMEDQGFAVETRMRLTKIHGNHADKATKQLMKLARTSGLLEDTEYLIWVLGKTEDATDKMVLAKQLSKLTNQSFGADSAKWSTWFAENKKTEEVATKTAKRHEVDDQTGPLDSTSVFVHQLIKFTNNQGELQLDRKHWGQPFGDHPVKESVGKVEALMKENNLPLEWLNPGGEFSLDSTEYPQVIFGNMAAKLRSEDKTATPQKPIYAYANQVNPASRNRFAKTNMITAKMQFHGQTGKAQPGRLVAADNNQKPPAAKYFNLQFKERTDAKRVLEIHESENNTISITLISDSVDTIIRMVQHPATNADVPAESRCVIYDIRGDQTQERKAANFDDLYQENASYMNDEWLPLMRHFGIQIETPTTESQ